MRISDWSSDVCSSDLSVGLHRGDAVVAAGFVGIHLAAADRLAVGRGEVEEELAVAGGLALEAGVVLAVLAHRFDAVDARAFGRITLAAQDPLAVAGLEIELELAVGALADLEIAGHTCPLESLVRKSVGREKSWE